MPEAGEGANLENNVIIIIRFPFFFLGFFALPPGELGGQDSGGMGRGEGKWCNIDIDCAVVLVCVCFKERKKGGERGVVCSMLMGRLCF